MKVIKLFIIFFFGALHSDAQTASNEASLLIENKVVYNHPYSHISNEAMKYNFSRVLNMMATEQVKTYLSENVVYPNLMITNGIEGRAVIQIVLSGNGNIEDYLVVKSPHELFAKAIDRAMDKFKIVDTKGKDYEGFHKVFLALDFSIVN